MKIAVISNLYPPFVRGGAEIVAAMEAQGLKKSWQHVFAISTRPAKVKFIGAHIFRTGLWTTSVDTFEEVDVYRFNPVNLYYYLDDFKFPSFLRLFWHIFDIFNIFSYFKIKKILLKEKPDVVITHNLMGIGFLVPMLIRNLKIKHLHTVHDVQLVTPSGLIIKGKENAFSHRFFRYIGYVALMRKLMGSPDVVVSPSKFLMDFYTKNGFFKHSKKAVIPNPIRSLMKMPKTPTPNLELVYLGQIHRAKGVLDLIDSFIKIKLPHMRLHIVGVGEDLPRAKHKAKDDKRIIFHGWLPNHKLLPLLSSMDVMLVPSLCYENSPTVIYESLSMGMPVIASDIGGASELIVENINGWSFPAGDFDILNKKIVGLYKQREKIAKMADNCRISVKQHNLENYINKILELINRPH
ncbi:glycosyltransferase [Patescibacteria group bacterium]|nr:glycosyltransferase [Patescibacteria group bacterium]